MESATTLNYGIASASMRTVPKNFPNLINRQNKHFCYVCQAVICVQAALTTDCLYEKIFYRFAYGRNLTVPELYLQEHIDANSQTKCPICYQNKEGKSDNFLIGCGVELTMLDFWGVVDLVEFSILVFDEEIIDEDDDHDTWSKFLEYHSGIDEVLSKSTTDKDNTVYI
uniref:Uncharacterized protein n=1 Tax=Romanomermis culicivorax TaxID=13658 RepID=A0A915J846_ROMCU